MLHHIVIGDGTPVVILHGSRLDHRHMLATLEPAFDGTDGWRRIYVDMPGHGLSAGQESIRSQDDLLAALLAFIDDALGDEPFAIIGESRGSYLARGIVQDRPEQVLGAALIVPGGNPGTDPDRLPRHQVLEPAPELREGLDEDVLKRFDNFMVVQSAAFAQSIVDTKLPAVALHDAAQEARVSASFALAFERAGQEAYFDKPSLIVVGRQDSMSGYLDGMDLVQIYTRATLAVVDAAGHGVADDRPALYTALIRDWLARMRAALTPGAG